MEPIDRPPEKWEPNTLSQSKIEAVIHRKDQAKILGILYITLFDMKNKNSSHFALLFEYFPQLSNNQITLHID